MTLISQFAGSAGKQRIRLTKPVQQLTVRRTGTLCVTERGLVDGLPEKISMEITHPSRKRADGGQDLPLGMLALWAQYLRGPIVETVAEGGKVVTEVVYFLNQSSPIEVTSEDQFFVNFLPVTGHSYEIDAPEQPVLGAAGSCFYNYELERILASDREKTLYTSEHVGLILPASSAIELLNITYQLPGGGQKEEPYTMRELLSQAQSASPFVSAFNPASFAAGTRLALTQDADYLLLSLNYVPSIEIRTKLGEELDYMLVKVVDRTFLG